jgi:small-conductance mechanosensitive channel
MPSLMGLATFDQLLSRTREIFYQQVLSWNMAIQIMVIGMAMLLAFRVSWIIQDWFNRLRTQCVSASSEAACDFHFLIILKRTIRSFLAFILIWIAFSVAEHYHWPRQGLYMAGIILLALTFVGLLTGEMLNRFWARVLAGVIWFWAALYITDLIEIWFHLLSNINFSLGNVQVSMLHLTRSIPILLVMYWLSRNCSMIWRVWLATGSGLSPAVQVMFSRLGSIFLFITSITIVLTYLGLDLTVFTLFSGALGFGLGFGLQKIFANLVSGFILLADKSIKPGDVIQLGDKYGWINFLGSRYISVVTRGGTEHLIPNEKLITSEVINWSYSQKLVRLKVPIGVDYASDLEKARDLMLETAVNTPRVLTDPAPTCYLSSFGDNAVNLELRVWINDPQNGIGSVKSNLHWGIWKRFKQHGIEMPCPQRDVHLKSMPELRIATKSANEPMEGSN